MSVSASDPSPFPYANGKLFPDSYFGQTEPATHHLPIFSGGGDTPSFKDVLDTINPLQHIPVISTIYRAITGDEPTASARLAGGALYGGPIGLVGELINCAIEDHTGKDVGDHMVAMIEDGFGSSPSGDGSTQLAAASPAAAAAAGGATAATPAPGAQTADAQTAMARTAAAAEPPAPLAAPQSPVAAAPIKLAAAQLTPPPAGPPAAKPMPLPRGAPMRFLPVPPRQAVQPVQPPPVAEPLSNDGTMSHVPITGRPTYTPAGPSAATVQRVLAAEGQAGTPLGAGPPGMTASGAPPVPAGQDWFTASMTQALDQYQKTSKLSAAPPATASP